MLDRRTLLTGILGVIAAPAIVRASSLMPVKAWVDEPFVMNMARRASKFGGHGPSPYAHFYWKDGNPEFVFPPFEKFASYKTWVDHDG